MFESIKDMFIGTKLSYTATDAATGKVGNFTFNIVKKLSGYRAYILERPPLEGRDGSMSKVHVLSDNGKMYVCVVQTIRTRKRMVEVAKLWARKYIRYIATGKLYDEK